MAVIDVNLNPSRRSLLWFGLVPVTFFGLLGGVVLWRSGAPGAATVLGSIGVVLGVAFYAVAPLRKPMYVGWMYAVYPIGWVVSHVCLGAVYFLVLTPIGLGMRLSGRDPLRRKLDPKAETYWTPHDPAGDAARYFRQS